MLVEVRSEKTVTTRWSKYTDAKALNASASSSKNKDGKDEKKEGNEDEKKKKENMEMDGKEDEDGSGEKRIAEVEPELTAIVSKKDTKSDKKEQQIQAQKKFAYRLSEVIKASAAGEILAQSTSTNGKRNLICLDMMGLAEGNQADSEEYDLEAKQSKKKGTQAADRSANTSSTIHQPQSHIDPVTTSNGTAKRCSGGIGMLYGNDTAGTGVDSFEFSVSVPRMIWTHIALVATKTPTDRVTLYIVRSFNVH